LADFRPVRRVALLLGAGGSARALAIGLVGAGYDLRLYNRTFAKAGALAADLELSGTQILREADPGGASLIVNTTSASLANEEIPVLWQRAEPGALAYDLMYAEGPTAFLRSAALHGLDTMDGRQMLVAQGARSFEWWLGIPAPRDVMLQAIQ